MSFMNPVDMVEEDAADLQFPKVAEPPISLQPTMGSKQKIVKANNTADTKFVICTPTKLKQIAQLAALEASLDECDDLGDAENPCSTCKKPLQEPYIKCNDCDAQVCLECFASGRETTQHQNNHAYIVIRGDVQVFADAGNWTAREERILLKTLQTHGYGNWSAVSRALNWQRTKDACRRHYQNCYFGGIFERLLDLQHERDVYFPQNLPYIAKLRSVDPPRNDDIVSIQFKMMAGYRCARGDFDVPYDPSAELILTTITDLEESDNSDEVDLNENYSLAINSLKFALVNAYNHRLRERLRRYKVMRDHGLIVSNRTLAWISRYTEAFGSEANCNRFLSFMQICSPFRFDLLVESLNLFAELRRNIFRLYEARQNGVKTLHGCSLYFKLKKKRLQKQRDSAKNQNDWRKLIPNIQGNSVVPQLAPFLMAQNMTISNPRRKPPPMEVIGLPGYTKLTDEERKLCSVERIPPEAFLDYKTSLISENAKSGQLRLADARRLIKIDVNKTRKIYDFLIENGHINKAT